MSSATITVTALTPTWRSMTFGTSRSFSTCCWTVQKINTKIPVRTETVKPTRTAGMADSIGPTTGIISPTAATSASFL